MTFVDEARSKKGSGSFKNQWLGAQWERSHRSPYSPFYNSISSLEFRVDVFAALAAKFSFEFIGLVFAALPLKT